MVKKRAPLALAILLFALLACVSQSEYDELQAQYQQAQQQYSAFSAQVAADKAQINRLQGAIKYTVNSDLLFSSGSWEMSERGKQIIANMAAKLVPTQQNHILVSGYTDNAPIGRALERQGVTSNEILSQKRAESVMAFLVSQGVKPDLISAKGFGDADPVASNDTAQGRAQDRRIEISLIAAGDHIGTGPSAPQDPRLINVLYATNRAIDGPAVGKIDANEITDKRSPNLAYGSAVIRVPEAHKIGQVERPTDTTFFGITVATAKADDKKHFVAKQFVGLSKDQFVDLIKRSKNDGAMLFVHGIATPFFDAIFKTAQIAFDTNFPGVPITFAWPSKGTWWPTDYDYDRESALFSRDAFLDTLRLIHNHAGISKLYVIAHSMGNQIVVDALAHAQDAGIGITELVMAAPDVDSDVFRSMVTRLRTAAKGLTLYVSSADKAMLASRVKAGGAPRAGDVPTDGPLVADGVDTIDVTAIGDDLFALNHSEYSSNRTLLDDIGRILLASTRPPDVRSPQLRRVPERSEHPLYWRYAE